MTAPLRLLKKEMASRTVQRRDVAEMVSATPANQAATSNRNIQLLESHLSSHSSATSTFLIANPQPQCAFNYSRWQSEHPRARYPLTPWDTMASRMRRLLPDAFFDKMLRESMGLGDSCAELSRVSRA